MFSFFKKPSTPAALPKMVCGHLKTKEYALSQISDYEWMPIHKCLDCGQKGIEKPPVVRRGLGE